MSNWLTLLATLFIQAMVAMALLTLPVMAPVAAKALEVSPALVGALRADLEARDARDASRSVAPLQPAQDALHLDNSNVSIEDSVAQVLQWWQSKQAF